MFEKAKICFLSNMWNSPSICQSCTVLNTYNSLCPKLSAERTKTVLSLKISIKITFHFACLCVCLTDHFNGHFFWKIVELEAMAEQISC